jgi:integrase
MGTDPIEARRSQQLEKQAQAARVVTFREEAEAYVQAHQSSWRNAKHADQWRSTLETYVYPTIGSAVVAEVDTGMIVKILEPIWSKKTETANRVRGRIERILSRAASRGHRSGENPARWRGHLENILPARGRVAPVKHHAALHYSQIGDFITELRAQPGIAAQALELTILCTTRTIETIGAGPDEFDLAQNLWTIPAERMKMKREHRIPLTPRAREILEPLLKDAGEFVFPGPDPRKHMSNNAMLALLERMGRGDITVHGFRSSFKDWASECTGFPAEVAEMALAHVVHDKVEAAYGPDAAATISMNFGPMNRQGGERRLNVAVTRARHGLKVFSSIRADQVDLSRTAAIGVRDLRHFLEFAECGARAIAEANMGSIGGHESPFETAVAEALSRRGWQCLPQIGVSAFRIDLGIVDPDAPGLAGIECDGATYHRSATARDRDKLRERVLTDLGWKIVRIWSTDWWLDPEGTLDKTDLKLKNLMNGRSNIAV